MGLLLGTFGLVVIKVHIVQFVYLFSNVPQPHCKDMIPKIRNKYSQKRKCVASVPISTFMCLWAIYIVYSHNQSAYSAAEKYVDRSWEYINRSQTQECWAWDWGPAISFLGIHKWDFRCSAEQWLEGKLYAICIWALFCLNLLGQSIIFLTCEATGV